MIKKTEERKLLQEVARREMNQKKVFEYSKYVHDSQLQDDQEQ